MPTSTEVRANLKKFLVAAQKGDVFINMNDEYVATLTCDEPEVTAMRLKITEAKSNFADIIALVMYQNAVFKFKLLDHDPVYLIKDSDLECPLLDLLRPYKTISLRDKSSKAPHRLQEYHHINQ